MTTNEEDFTANPKLEINSLDFEEDENSINDESQSASNPDNVSISMKQPSDEEFAAIDEFLYEKDDKAEENVMRQRPVLSATPFVTQPTVQGHSLDIFFRAMCATVKTFPNTDIAEIKLKISQIVGTKEIEIMNRASRQNPATV